MLVFWRGFGVVWTLFLQSLETWQVDLEVFLASVWEQVQHRGPGAEGRSADEPAERLLNRLLLGWAGMAALFEIVFLVGYAINAYNEEPRLSLKGLRSRKKASGGGVNLYAAPAFVQRCKP